jgi:branched-chain amino acid transport system permease protein
MRRACGVFDESYKMEMAICRTRFQWGMLIALLFLILALIPQLAGDGILSMINMTGITLIATLGLNILTGYCGQISLGHAIFVGSGGYISGMLMNHLGWPWWSTLPFAGLGTAIVGILFGLPSLRIKGFYFAMSTLGAYFIINWVLMHGGTLTGGINGLPVSNPKLFGIDVLSQRQFYYLIMSFTIIGVFFAKNAVRGRLGRAFIAIRDNELVAEFMGINTFYYKLIAFAICSAYAGIAGCLLATYFGSITFEQFPFMDNVWYIGYVIVGGMGSIAGTIFGVVFLKIVSNGVMLLGPIIAKAIPAIAGSIVSALMMIGFGVIITLFVIFEPRGLNHRWELTRSSFQIWPFTY